MKAFTPSFLSLSRAPCRKSLDTSSFSSNHMTTNGSNQLQRKERAESAWASVPRWERQGVDAVYKTLTLDTQVRASGKCAALCSTHCRAISPWSASSYNLRFYTGGSSHALSVKEKERLSPTSPLFLHIKFIYKHKLPWHKQITCDPPPNNNNTHKHLPSMAYFISCANIFHMTSALILPTFSSWGNLWEAVLMLKSTLYPAMLLYYSTREPSFLI